MATTDRTTPSDGRELRYEHVPGWEQLPAGMAHLDAPGVAVDSQDRVHVLGRRQHGVHVFDRAGRFLRRWGDDSFVNPHGITIGPDDSVYLVDNVGHAVFKCSPEGERLLAIGPSGVPSDTGYDHGAGDVIARTATVQRAAGPFNSPTNLAVAPDGDLYVTDGYGNARVHRFSPDGTLKASWGEPGSEPGQFMLPHGIAVAPDGRVYVADRENDRVQVFSPGGRFLEQWTDLQRPTQVRLDRQGRVYVSELWKRAGLRSFRTGPAPHDREGRFSVFSPDGRLLARYGGRDTLDGIHAPGRLASPHDIAVDSRGDVYVAEVTYADWARTGEPGAECHTLQKFSQVG
jgi:DNA-binding beta-propeller fold protein YncE